MGFRDRFASLMARSMPAVTAARRETPAPPSLPARMPADHEPTGLIQVFRAVQVLETAVSALPIVQLDRAGRQSIADGIVNSPSLDMTRRELVSYLVACLATDGNLFLLKRRVGDKVIDVMPLPPREVAVTDMSADPRRSDIRYSWRGLTFGREDVIHKRLVAVPGRLRGLGPIGSCRVELEGMADTRDFAANWREEAGVPSGIYTTEVEISDEEADDAKRRIMSAKSGQPLVLGKNVRYARTLLSPEDMQFVQSRQFDGVQVARLFGIPANLMLTGTDGSSLTYTNIEQSWIEFSSYTLAAYADPICEALGELLPGRRAVAMDWDSSRRSDTGTRYAAYKTALEAGFLTVGEVRAREGLAPLETQPDKETSNAQ
ncbi:phage portal protein [Bifidobacterium lemurum]|nr:phage portal protein [Bifidobacterium lemurum]QOL34599.1 phage portal protein [Bifidobacterium lemurum]